MSSIADTLRDNDFRLAEYLSSLTGDQWAQPSLCTEWTNLDVLAHLVAGYSAQLSAIITAMLRHRGSFDQANSEMAHTRAAQQDPRTLVDDFITLTQQARGVGRIFPRRLLLGDHVIHELDIAYALGTQACVPATVLTAVLDTQTRIPNPFVPARARARNLNLIATDASWSHPNDGPTVSGEAGHLASVLAGRPWAMRHLAGDGVPILTARLSGVAS